MQNSCYPIILLHDAPLGHIILILIQPVFALTTFKTHAASCWQMYPYIYNMCTIICPVIGIIHVHCRKMYNSFIRAKETGRKAILWQTFLHCFASSANEFIFFDSVYILYLPCNVKIPKEMAISLKIAETHHWNIWDLLFLTRSEQTNTFLSGSFSVQSLN